MFSNPSGEIDSSKCVPPLTHPFRVPQRGIQTAENLESWLRSGAYQDYLGFIATLNLQVRGVRLSVNCTESPVVQGLVDMMERWESWVGEHKWFKSWCSKVRDNCLDSLQEVLPSVYYRAVPEIQEYLQESLGSSLRTDYGPGHEMNFCIFLYCLYKIGALTGNDNLAVVCKVFNRYLQLVRRLQLNYGLQPGPNGGRGYWALDDHQFVSFIWGSSQLIDHPMIHPRSYLQDDMLAAYGDEYMFLGCIRHINQVKTTGMLAEHSSQLWFLSASGYWETINKGLVSMYKAEVLAKFAVIQYTLFGSLVSLVPAPLPKLNLAPREIIASPALKKPAEATPKTPNKDDSKTSSS